MQQYLFLFFSIMRMRKFGRLFLWIIVLLTSLIIGYAVIRSNLTSTTQLDTERKRDKAKPNNHSTQTYANTTSYDLTRPSSSKKQSPSVILLWTTFWGNPKWNLPRIGRHPFSDGKCQYNNCVVEINKTRYMESADMLLFNCADKVTLPSVRHPGQIYVAYCWEPPLKVKKMAYFQNLHANMTATYRPDSDIVDLAGFIKPKVNPTAGMYVPRYSFEQKNKTLVWMVSNCNANSKRQVYIHQLAQYVDLDIYGGCGKLKCSRHSGCLKKFEKKYKFYIAMENNICKGYVSEKLFETLKYELVPIVLGAVNYSEIAPPHSYINVRDFKSPKELATYLKFLSENEAEYNKYFHWKQKTEISQKSFYCDLCKAATKKNLISQGNIPQ